MEQIIITAAVGTSVGLIIKHFWDKWNKDCTDCKMIKALQDELITIKEICLELAAKAEIPIEKYKGLVK